MYRYGYKQGEPCTIDNEWYEGELLTLVEDKCHKTCEQLRNNINIGIDVVWYDEALLYDDILCTEVYTKIGKTLVELYNTDSDITSFDAVIDNYIKQIVNDNRYPSNTIDRDKK